MPQLVSISSRIRRLVALSSTTRTGRPCTSAGSAGAGRATGPRAGAEPRREVERAALADLALDPDLARPSSATSRAEIARPSPVPPYLRVVELSAWAKASKTLLLLVGGDADARVADGEVQADLVVRLRLARSTRSTTSPRSVNLMALPTRLTRTWRSRRGSPDEGVRHVGRDVVGQLQPFLVGAQGQRVHGVVEGVAEVEVDRVQVELAGLDLGEVEDVVDHGQQAIGRELHHPEVLALLAASARCRGPARSCR